MSTQTNKLYFGDCLDVMRNNIDDESVDLIYLDPPFNSKRIYNAFHGGAQWVAFDDTWQWAEAVDDYHDVAGDVSEDNASLADTIDGLKRILGEGGELAYLCYMANRLRECKRVLKSTGSIYLHCDPTMSHYLKLVMDGVFDNFLNEIIWRRTGSHNKVQKWAPIHEVLLFYSKSENYTWNNPKQPYMAGHVKEHFVPDNGRYKTAYYGNVLTGSGIRGGLSGQPWMGIDPTAKNRHWAIPSKLWEESGLDSTGLNQREKLDALYGAGFITIEDGAAWPMYERRIRDDDGPATGDIWAYNPYTEGTVFGKKEGIDADVSWIKPRSGEKTPYPTQKPVGLLNRILEASSKDGDVILDPFCGCGTTIHAAQTHQRSWIGIDICVKACQIIQERIEQHFDIKWSDVEFIGMPKTATDAKTLADLDKFRFEKWAASIVDGMEANKKQRGDKGIDGRGRIALRKGHFIDIVSQVKGGGTGPGDVQAFNGARQQAGAELGVFTCFKDKVTPRMRDAAASTGRFMNVPKIQIYTVEDFFEGRKPDFPRAA